MKNALATLVLLCCAAPLFAEPPQGYVLKWSDEFDGVELDQTKWVQWNPGKRRHAMNVPEAVTLSDGFLTITTYTEAGRKSMSLPRRGAARFTAAEVEVQLHPLRARIAGLEDRVRACTHG